MPVLEARLKLNGTDAHVAVKAAESWGYEAIAGGCGERTWNRSLVASVRLPHIRGASLSQRAFAGGRNGRRMGAVGLDSLEVQASSSTSSTKWQLLNARPTARLIFVIRVVRLHAPKRNHSHAGTSPYFFSSRSSFLICRPPGPILVCLLCPCSLTTPVLL
jgi:hypothetical protein